MQPNRVARILGIEKPVVQGPLSWLTDALSLIHISEPTRPY